MSPWLALANNASFVMSLETRGRDFSGLFLGSSNSATCSPAACFLIATSSTFPHHCGACATKIDIGRLCAQPKCALLRPSISCQCMSKCESGARERESERQSGDHREKGIAINQSVFIERATIIPGAVSTAFRLKLHARTFSSSIGDSSGFP